jgi:hypothetical protein
VASRSNYKYHVYLCVVAGKCDDVKYALINEILAHKAIMWLVPIKKCQK